MSTKKNIYSDLETDNDFGFTFTHEDEIMETNKDYSSLQEQVDDLKSRLQAIHKIFMPLLDNLSKDPEKPMIKWPNRKEQIDKQIKKLKTLTTI